MVYLQSKDGCVIDYCQEVHPGFQGWAGLTALVLGSTWLSLPCLLLLLARSRAPGGVGHRGKDQWDRAMAQASRNTWATDLSSPGGRGRGRRAGGQTGCCSQQPAGLPCAPSVPPQPCGQARWMAPFLIPTDYAGRALQHRMGIIVPWGI